MHTGYIVCRTVEIRIGLSNVQDINNKFESQEF